MDNSGTLNWAVDRYIDKFSEPTLIEYLRNCFIIKQTNPEHEIIVNQFWKGYYTTNFDNLIETVLSEKKKKSRSTTSISKPSAFSSKRDVIVHLNGFIEHLDENTGIPNDFILNEIDYVTSEFLKSGWYNHLQSDIITSDAIFFVGFSMRSDLDISRIVYRAMSESTKEKIVFVVWEQEPESSIRFLSQFGHVVPIGVKGFADLVVKRKAVFVPHQQNELKLFSLKEYKPVSKAARIKSEDVFNLLFHGKSEISHIESSLVNPSEYKYFVRRSCINDIVKAIENGNRNIVITSDLGNGKSMLIEGLKVMLHEKDYKVFYYNTFYDSFENEIQKILELFPGCVLIIENYNHNLKAFEFLQTRRSPKSVLITSERSAVYETSFHRLEKFFGTDYLNFEVDRLDDSEIEEIIDILNTYGLWGDYSNLTDTEKVSFIKNTCNSNLRSLLLKLIESKAIVDKFKQVIAEIKEQKNYFEAVVLILSTNLFNISLELYQLISILNNEKFRKPNFTQNSAIKELIDFSSGTIKVKSSVLSEMILSKSSNAYSIVQAILKICEQLDYWRDDPTYVALFREYVSFSNIYSLVKYDSENVINAIDLYFDELRNLNFCRENPHYWLQYAILSIEKGNLNLAKTHFDTAYSYAKKKSRFDTYMLDNQHARLILLNQIDNGNAKTCMSAFREAHQILTSNLSPNRAKYYPYKVAKHYI
ncbi:MAG: SIR2 family protein, partial [Chitinophagaceae bacterium]